MLWLSSGPVTEELAPADPPSRLRIAVFISGTGTLLQALLDAASDAGAPFAVSAVFADREASGLERARRAGVPTVVASLQDFRARDDWNQAVARAVDTFTPDLIVLAGFMKILSEPLVSRFAGRMINTHPALLPSFPGPHGVRDALAYGVKVTGCSVILVDAGTDAGPIVAQRAVQVLDGDDEVTLHERIKTVERELIVDVVSRIALGGMVITGRHVTLT